MLRRWFSHPRFLLMLLIGGLVAGFLVFEAWLYGSTQPGFRVVDLLLYLYTTFRAEVVILMLALLLINWLNKRWAVKQEKQRLLIQLGSPDHAFAVEAVRVLRVRGWVTDGSLKKLFLANASLSGAGLWNADLQEAELMGAALEGANLHRANLHRAKLWEANLRHAELMTANLSKANLRKCSLAHANLWEANLCGAVLEFADLQNANLRKANLKNALLNRADLRGVNFLQANLQGASLHHAQFDAQSTLPDGGHWSPQVDLSRFTHSDHPDFWRPPPDDQGRPLWYLKDKANEDEDQPGEGIAYAWAS